MTIKFGFQKTLLFILTIICFSSQIGTSQDKVWIGGNGDFSDGSMWDPVGVPTIDDSLRISSGEVVLNSSIEVERLYLFGAASFHISNGAELTIKNSTTNGLWCNSNGEVLVEGKLIIEDSEISGILVGENLTVGTGGQIIIKNSQRGIDIRSNDTLFNYGMIEVDSTNSSSINNLGIIYNYEAANISCTGSGFNSADNAVTHNFGSIDNINPAGFVNRSGTFYNYAGATLSVTNSADRGMWTQKLYNYENALLSINNSGSNINGIGLFITSGDTLFNYGAVSIDQSAAEGIKHSGHISNFQTGTITINNSGEDGILVSPGASILTHGTISVNNSGKDGLLNANTLMIGATGVLSISNSAIYGINLLGTITNFGILSTQNSTSDGLLNDEGSLILKTNSETYISN